MSKDSPRTSVLRDNELIRRGDAKAKFGERGLAFVRSGLDALPAVQPTVKPLVWRSNGKGHVCADTPFGLYEIERGSYGMRLLHGGSFMQDDLQGIEAAKAAAQADYEARIMSALTTGKEVMPNDDGNSNARPATSPGVTAGAVSPDVAALVDAVRALRDAMHNNIVVNDEPHTVVLPDGSRHSGPVVDFLHALLGAQISVLDAALARVKGVM